MSYWAGAILDFLAAIRMMFPAVLAATGGLSDFHPAREYSCAMGMGDSLMLGWPVLLLWADRKPLERKGILPLTVFPVMAGMMINDGDAAFGSGFLSRTAVVPVGITVRTHRTVPGKLFQGVEKRVTRRRQPTSVGGDGRWKRFP
jgi:hypothetical protein